jgi:hypothetical protein
MTIHSRIGDLLPDDADIRRGSGGTCGIDGRPCGNGA